MSRSSKARSSGRFSLGTKTKNIIDLSLDSKKEFLASFDFVFCACDGVIWMMNGTIPQTGPAIMLLKEWGKDIIYVSNNSMRSDKEYIEKLNSIGVAEMNVNNIINPVKLITRYLKSKMTKKMVFSLCSQEMNEVLKNNEISVRTMKPSPNLYTENLLEEIAPECNYAAVVLDLNFNLSFPELMRAHQYLLNDDCSLLVGASDTRLPINVGFPALGFGGFLNILMNSTSKDPIVFGKPGAQLADYLIDRFRLTDRTGRALIIGDNLITDIGFGITYHFQTLFVPTGASTLEELKKLPEHLKPDYFAKSLADFIEFFDELRLLKENWMREFKNNAEGASSSRRSSSVPRGSEVRRASEERSRPRPSQK